MANYTASCRTNYFRVKDEQAFMNDLVDIPAIEIIHDKKGFAILGACPDGSGWPSSYYDEKNDVDIEIDLPDLVSPHLRAGEVAVFMEVGAEKLRYLIGFSEAINNQGERLVISLESIYEQAKHLGSSITEVAY